MKTIKYLLLGFVLIFGISACELPDNVDPKETSEVPAETLFTNAVVALFNQVDDVNVNRNVMRLITQYWQETTYFDESRYLFQDRKIPDNYATRFYRFALMDFKEAKKVLTDPEYGGNADERDNMVAIIEICEVYGWQCLVDAFGNMPY
ncbi:MAG: SusD/RagB family nutrient-binding outer membrane lipoprotein, partial [Bacteroidales bacterium]|nr:SusD/RagB family nutrient-binding outer membrane lipoprotein [Bacteroidales bacterium]